MKSERNTLKHSNNIVNTVLKDIPSKLIGTAISKIEKTKSSETSQQPVVRERNIDLQSKLRDLMKCGSSTNTTNPFASRKLEVPSSTSTMPLPLPLQLQQQPGIH